MTNAEDVKQVVSTGLRELAAELRQGHGITKDAAISLLHTAANLLDQQPSPARDSLVHININVGKVRTAKDLETVKRVVAVLKTLTDEPDAKDAIPPVSDPFAELLELPENWDSYGAAKVDPRAVAAARRFQEALLAAPQSVVPICTGGVQIEMHRCGFDFEVSFNPDGTVEEACAKDAEADASPVKSAIRECGDGCRGCAVCRRGTDAPDEITSPVKEERDGQ